MASRVPPIDFERLRPALRAAGTFDPDYVLPKIEEQLTPREANDLEAFLAWVTDNQRPFGRATYADRWAEWQLTLTHGA